MGSEEGLPGRRCPQGPPRGRERSAAEGKGSKGRRREQGEQPRRGCCSRTGGRLRQCFQSPTAARAARRAPQPAPGTRQLADPDGPRTGARARPPAPGQLLPRPRCPAASCRSERPADAASVPAPRPGRRAREPRVTPRAQPARCLHPPPAPGSALAGGAPCDLRPPRSGSVPHPAATHTDRLPGGAGSGRSRELKPEIRWEASWRKGHRETRGRSLGILGRGQELTPAAQSGICSPSLKRQPIMGSPEGKPTLLSSSLPARSPCWTPCVLLLPLPMGSYGLFVPQIPKAGVRAQSSQGVQISDVPQGS